MTAYDADPLAAGALMLACVSAQLLRLAAAGLRTIAEQSMEKGARD